MIPRLVQHGFSLVEMAVVMVILAMLIGGLIAPLTVGFLLDAYELTTPFLFISFTCLVMGASTILLFRKKLI